MAEPFLGEIMIFAGNFEPAGWAFCDGRLLPINQNTALFAVIGNTYGGDGITTFALPDLRGRVPLGIGQGPGLGTYQIGQKAGTEHVVLTTGNLPSHDHALGANSAAATETSPTGHVPASPVSGTTAVKAYSATANAALAPTGHTGGGTPFDNHQPFLSLNFIGPSNN